LIIAAALPPMPPETERGAMVLVEEPINTPESASDVRIVFPKPFGVRVKLPLAPVAMVSGPESLKLLAESVCVAALIESPLIVWLVLAAMIPPIERLFARVKLPALVRLFAPEKKLMLPVEALPNCNVCLFVVPRTPVPVSNVALLPLPAEIEAVGMPELTFVNANFALPVDVAPSRRSSVGILSVMAPLVSSNGEPPFTTGRMPVTLKLLSAKLTADEERTPVEEM